MRTGSLIILLVRKCPCVSISRGKPSIFLLNITYVVYVVCDVKVVYVVYVVVVVYVANYTYHCQASTKIEKIVKFIQIRLNRLKSVKPGNRRTKHSTKGFPKEPRNEYIFIFTSKWSQHYKNSLHMCFGFPGPLRTSFEPQSWFSNVKNTPDAATLTLYAFN